MAIIKSIGKEVKDKMYIKNWRPISLLNVDVKIASKAMAKRLESVKADGSFLSFAEIQLKALQSNNFLFWYGLIDAIPT